MRFPSLDLVVADVGRQRPSSERLNSTVSLCRCVFTVNTPWEKVNPTGSSSVRWDSWLAWAPKAALERLIGTRIQPDARIRCWLVEVAAQLMNWCDIGTCGVTPLHRLHGRKDNTPIPEFGEKILYMPATAIPSWSVCWHVELGRQRQWLSPSKGWRIKTTRSERQENSWVREVGRGSNTRNASCPVVSRWLWQ